MIGRKWRNICSFVVIAAVLCTAMMIPAAAQEGAEGPETTLLYAQDFDTSPTWGAPDAVPSWAASKANAGTSVAEADSGNGTKAIRGRGATYAGQNTGVRATFTEPFTAEDGVLKLSYDMRILNMPFGQAGSLELVSSSGTAAVLMPIYQDIHFTKPSDWQGHWDELPLCGYKDGTYDAETDTYSGGTPYTVGEKTADDYNNITLYLDLKNEAIAAVVNGNLSLHNLSEVFSTIPVDITGFDYWTQNEGDMYYDNFRAEAMAGMEIGDIFFSKSTVLSTTLASGGLKNIDFEGAYVDLKEIGADADTQKNHWTKALPIGNFSYDFGETLTAESGKTLYLKFNFAVDPDLVYSSGDCAAWLNLVGPGTGSNNCYFASAVNYRLIRDGGAEWNAWWTTGNIDTMASDADNFKYQVEAYLDVSTGKMAVQYGTGPDAAFAIKPLHPSLLQGISKVQGSGDTQIFIDDVTVQAINGDLYQAAAANGSDLGVASLPALYTYEAETKNTVILPIGGETQNKAHLGMMTLPFSKSYRDGVVYIGFDFAETQAISGRLRYFSVLDGLGNSYRIAGINDGSAGMMSSSNDWQALEGALPMDDLSNQGYINKLHRVDIILNMDAGLFRGYLDGNLLSELTMDTGAENDWSGLLENGVGGFEVTDERSTTYGIDNLAVTHFEEGFAVQTAKAEGNTVDIRFSAALTAAEMEQLLQKTAWTQLEENEEIADVSKVTQTTLRLTLSAPVSTAYGAVRVPDVNFNGLQRPVTGVAAQQLNNRIVHYSANDVKINGLTFIGCDGKYTYPLTVEPGATKVMLSMEGEGRPQAIALTKDGVPVSATAAEQNTEMTLASPLEAGSYVLAITGADGQTDTWNFTTSDGSYTITDAAFTDADGSPVTNQELLAGGSYRFTVTAKNTKDIPESCYAIVAWYGANNKMIDCAYVLISNAAYDAQSATVEFTIPSSGDVKYIHGCVWNNFDDIIPLIKRVSVTHDE